MGLREKVLGLVLVGFGLMMLLSTVVLKVNLADGFQSIEKAQAVRQMEQLTQNLNGELDHLGQVTYDWGNWDELYQFAQHPNKEFSDHQFAPSSLKEIDIKWVAVLDAADKPEFSLVVNLMNGEADTVTSFDNVLANILKSMQHTVKAGDKSCGLDTSASGPILVCWQGIRKSDLSGVPVGTLIIGRLLNRPLLDKIQMQSNIKFEMHPVSMHEAEQSLAESAPLAAQRVEFNKVEPGVLDAYLTNSLGHPVQKISLHFPTDLSAHGEALRVKIQWVILGIMFVAGLALLAGLYFLVVRRLLKMDKELSSIWRNGRWAGRVEETAKNDEINTLSNLINRMLALIRKQSVMLESIALTDSLTQIANRRAFDERLTIELATHLRNQTPLSLMMIDLDHFDRYNELYGQPAGDDILKTIGHLTSHVACRPSDLPARIGGEEFAVILPATDLDGACHVAELFNTKLAELKIVHGDSPVSAYLTACIGVTSAGQDDVASLMQRAEKALFNAKHAGRNKVCVLQAG